jgi:Haem-binding domain
MKKILLGLVVFLIVAQVVRFPRTNPTIDPSREIGAAIPLTPTVSGIFERSCNDCHSDRTVWLWYSGVVPSSWLVIYDVHGARQKMNFSEWNATTPQQHKQLLDRMCSEVTNGDMPEWQYLIMHQKSKLSPEDVQAVCAWSKAASANLPQ